MAQSQVIATWMGEAGGSAHWEPSGAVGEQPLDIWSRLPDQSVVQQPIASTHQAQELEIAHVLSAWRAAERQLDDLVEASPMRFVVLSEIARLRAEYQRLFAQAMR